MGEPFYYFNIALSILLFSLGTLGVLWQRNALSVFMSVELMLNAANLALITFAQYVQEGKETFNALRFGDPAGGALVLFVITIAAAEAGVGFAIFIRLYRMRQTIELEEADELQG